MLRRAIEVNSVEMIQTKDKIIASFSSSEIRDIFFPWVKQSLEAAQEVAQGVLEHQL